MLGLIFSPKKFERNLLVLILYALALTACRPAALPSPTLPLPSPTPLDEAYPGPTLPVITPSAPATSAVRFQIDRPVRTGATVVKGSGPAGIPIAIINVTDMGAELGAGVIDPNNRFAIAVSPLPVNVRIGLTLGDLTGTSYTYEQFNEEAYKGEEALLVPLVGYFQDTALVQP